MLIARLYDPVEGAIYFCGRDLREIPQEERSRKIGYVLQEPFLFDGSVYDNLVYGAPAAVGQSVDALMDRIQQLGLQQILDSFAGGLHMGVGRNGSALSLGQRQLVAFFRAVLRLPLLLILDEVTANLDPVTERAIARVLSALPVSTTKIIIAHRLASIEQADEIFFVGGGGIRPAGTTGQAEAMLCSFGLMS